MLTFHGTKQRFCDRLSRRDFFKVGALTVGGLTLADLLRLRATGATEATAANKAVIMVYLNGGPSHIDMYDMKPNAPVEYRWRIQADPDQRRRHGHHAQAIAVAGDDCRQVRHRPQHEVPAGRPHAAGTVHRLPARQNRPAVRLGRRKQASSAPDAGVHGSLPPMSTSAMPITSAVPVSSAKH